MFAISGVLVVAGVIEGSALDRIAGQSAGCGSDLPTLRATGCALLFEDTGRWSRPNRLWGGLSCEARSRHSLVDSGGDPADSATGAPQSNDTYRRLTVLDGDDYWGERCELGKNSRFTSPVTFYHEGERRITFASLRLSNLWPINDPNWQTILQMKQTSPYDGGGSNGVALELQVRDGRWIFRNNWDDIWSAPASANQWTRFAFDITYSQDPSKGKVKVYVDLNGDGDASDEGEQSPLMQRPTLATEGVDPNGQAADDDGLEPGDPIPSHLRLGIYHNPKIPCPAPEGCAADVDNVQVVGA